MRSEQQSGEWCQRDLETMVEKQSVCIHVDGLNKLLMSLDAQVGRKTRGRHSTCYLADPAPCIRNYE
jgi:hypothetical protein